MGTGLRVGHDVNQGGGDVTFHDGGSDFPRVAAGVDVTIVVPTLRRQESLPALVARLFSQVECDSVSLEVLIVDNCPQESARPAVSELCHRYGQRLCYISEKRPGVSHVRNTGVRAAKGALIAFIDDDELPLENWLMSMLMCRLEHSADVVLGPVYPDFEDQKAASDEFFRDAFTQASKRPTGTVVQPKSPLRLLFRPGACYRTMATNNALVERRHLCRDEHPPFDPRLTRLGGEDLLFFHELYRAGKRIVWCREAAVFERIPPERSQLSYRLGRRFRDGQITSVTCLYSRPPRYGRLILSASVGLAQLFAGSALAFIFVLVGSRWAREAIAVMLAGAGKLLWMPRYHHRNYGLHGGQVASRRPPPGDPLAHQPSERSSVRRIGVSSWCALTIPSC